MGSDPTEQCEAAMVVAPVVAVGADVRVAVAAVEEGRVDDVGRQAAVRQATELEHDHRGAEGRAEARDRAQVAHAFEDRRQPRQQQARFEPLLDERGRQGGHDIGQPSGFDERKDFGSDVKNAHGLNGKKR